MHCSETSSRKVISVSLGNAELVPSGRDGEANITDGRVGEVPAADVKVGEATSSAKVYSSK